jgi:hypothetical protein
VLVYVFDVIFLMLIKQKYNFICSLISHMHFTVFYRESPIFLPISFALFCSYGNMALFYHGLNQTELALRHMSRTLLLLSLASGPDHPDVAATLINVAMMYQDASNMNTALRYLQEALMKNERLLGPDHVQTAVCYHALAIAFSCMSLYKLSIQVNSDIKHWQELLLETVNLTFWVFMTA